MPELKINEISIKSKVNAIKNAGNEIDTNVSSIPNVSQCSGIMISEYRNRIDRISKLLDSYKALLIRDTDDILTVKDKLKDMDAMISKNLIQAGASAAAAGGGSGGGGGSSWTSEKGGYGGAGSGGGGFR